MVRLFREASLTDNLHRLGDLVNDWRVRLDLEPIPLSEGPLLAETLKISFTYCWSPALVSRPSDWPSYLGMCLDFEDSRFFQ